MSIKYIKVDDLLNYVNTLPYYSIIKDDIQSFIDKNSTEVSEWNLDPKHCYFIQASCDGMSDEEIQEYLMQLRNVMRSTYPGYNIIFGSTPPHIVLEEQPNEDNS